MNVFRTTPTKLREIALKLEESAEKALFSVIEHLLAAYPYEFWFDVSVEEGVIFDRIFCAYAPETDEHYKFHEEVVHEKFRQHIFRPRR